MVMPGKDAQKALQKQYNRQNDYIKTNYHRQTVAIKNDIYNRILELYGSNEGFSMSGYINKLIAQDIEKTIDKE